MPGGLNDDFPLDGDSKVISPELVDPEIHPEPIVKIEKNIEDTVVYVTECFNRAEELVATQGTLIALGGVSQKIALEAEAVMPGFLSDDRPLGYFTKEPSVTQYAQSLEEISTGIWALIAAGIAAVAALLYKFWKWFFSGKSSDGGGGGGGGSSDLGGGPYDTPEEASKADAIAEKIPDAIDQTDKELHAYGITTDKIIKDSIGDAPDGPLAQVMKGISPLAQEIMSNGEFFRTIVAVMQNAKKWQDSFDTALSKLQADLTEWNDQYDKFARLFMNEVVDADKDRHRTKEDIQANGRTRSPGRIRAEYEHKLWQEMGKTRLGRLSRQFDPDNEDMTQEKFEEALLSHAFYFDNNYKIRVGMKEMTAHEAGAFVKSEYQRLTSMEPKPFSNLHEAIQKFSRVNRSNIIENYAKLKSAQSKSQLESIEKKMRKIAVIMTGTDHKNPDFMERLFPDHEGELDSVPLMYHEEYPKRDYHSRPDDPNAIDNLPFGIGKSVGMKGTADMLRLIIKMVSRNLHGYIQILQVAKKIHESDLIKMDHLIKRAMAEAEHNLEEQINDLKGQKRTTPEDAKELTGIKEKLSGIWKIITG